MGADSDSGWDSAQADENDSEEEPLEAESEQAEEFVNEAAEEDESKESAPPSKPRGRKPKRKPLPLVPPAEKESSYQKRAHSVVVLEDETEETVDGPKKVRRVNFDEEYEEDAPSFARVTDRGGYAHTKTSRMKISEANKGKMPWNKGKNRTETAKSKISAGVRARNRAILLEKLKKLGMTEEEWFAKKKEIKLVREKVRKARLAVKEHEKEMEKERKKREEHDFNQAMVDAFDLENLAGEQNEPTAEPSKKSSIKHQPSRKTAPNSNKVDASSGPSINVGRFKAIARDQVLKGGFPKDDQSKEPVRSRGKRSASNAKPTVPNPTAHKLTATVKPNAIKPTAAVKPTATNPTAPSPSTVAQNPAKPSTLSLLIPTITTLPVNEVSLSTREIKWTPHPLGLPDASYSADCPEGGPGGLICCAICTAKYSRYLSSTFQDLESQQISALGDEVEEIMGYSRTATKLLTESIKAAKRGR